MIMIHQAEIYMNIKRINKFVVRALLRARLMNTVSTLLRVTLSCIFVDRKTYEIRVTKYTTYGRKPTYKADIMTCFRGLVNIKLPIKKTIVSHKLT